MNDLPFNWNMGSLEHGAHCISHLTTNTISWDQRRSMATSIAGSNNTRQLIQRVRKLEEKRSSQGTKEKGKPKKGEKKGEKKARKPRQMRRHER